MHHEEKNAKRLVPIRPTLTSHYFFPNKRFQKDFLGALETGSSTRVVVCVECTVSRVIEELVEVLDNSSSAMVRKS